MEKVVLKSLHPIMFSKLQLLMKVTWYTKTNHKEVMTIDWYQLASKFFNKHSSLYSTLVKIM